MKTYFVRYSIIDGENMYSEVALHKADDFNNENFLTETYSDIYYDEQDKQFMRRGDYRYFSVDKVEELTNEQVTVLSKFI